MYRLQHKTYNGFEDLDLGDEPPAMNYQINNLNELKDRQAAFSQSIKLPKTAHNLRQVGCLDHFDVRPDAVYEPKICVLSFDGAILTPFGSKLYVDKVDELPNGAIHCQIVAGVSDLFAALAGRSGDDMGDDDIWPGEWGSDLMDADNDNTNKRRRWPAIITEKGATAPPSTFNSGGAYQMYEMVPCYHYNTMIKEIFNKQGYDVETDLAADVFADQIYVSASKIASQSSELVRATGSSMRVPIIISGGGNAGVWLHPTLYQDDEYAGVLESHDPNYGKDVPRIVYVATRPADYQVDMTITNTGVQILDRGVRKIEYKIFKGKNPTERGSQIGSTITPTINPAQTHKYTSEPIHLNTGEFLAVQVAGWTAASSIPTTTLDFDIWIRTTDDQTGCGVGSRFDSVRDTGFKSHKEIVQSYIQLFGALVDVRLQPETGSEEQMRIGRVYIYTFNELYRRRDAGQVVDWSDKLLLNGERSASFTQGGYAQRNEIKLADGQADNAYDWATFTLPNKSLESNKTLFTLGIEASRSIRYRTINREDLDVVAIPTMERETDTDSTGGEVSELIYKGCGPHIVQIIDTTMEIYNKSGFRAARWTAPKELPIGVVAPIQKFVDNYYPHVVGMLRNGRTLSASFMLSPLDVEQLDLFTPVWVGHYQAHFYISKITNFVAGRPTAVELIKM